MIGKPMRTLQNGPVLIFFIICVFFMFGIFRKRPECFRFPEIGHEYITLTNLVQGPYCKLRTEFFSSSIYGPSAKRAGHNSKRKKRGSVNYGADRENEASKCVSEGLRNDFYSRGTALNF